MPLRSRRHYYGWYIAVTLAITETISWGILYYAFSVFLTPMEADLGWTRAELTGGFSLGFLVSGLMAYPVGAWIDRHGARGLMTAGSIGASVLVVAWSQVTDKTAFYLIWAGIGVCASAVLYEPAFIVAARWFHRRRSTALAIITFAAGLASTIFLPLSDLLLRHYGWRPAVLILGLYLAAMTIPLHLLVLRRRPSDFGLQPDGEHFAFDTAPPAPRGMSLRAVLRTPTFWFMTLGFGLASLSASAVRVHFIPLLIETGADSGTAAFATGAIGVMQVVGRLIFAPLDYRFSGRAIIVGVFGLQAVALAFLLLGQAPGWIVLFIVVFGAAQGAVTLARPSILAQLYGSTHYGRISSVMTFFLTLTSTAAPLAASLMYDATGSYQLVLWIVFALALAAVSVAFLSHRQSDSQAAAAIEAR